MGLVELAGGTKEWTFSAGACTPWGSKSILGMIKNKTNMVITDLTIELTAAEPASSKPPQLGSGSIGNSSFDGGGSTTKKGVPLGSGVRNESTVDATIGLTSPVQGTECTDFKLKLTPTGRRASVGKYDILEEYTFTSAKTHLGHGIESHGNSGVAAIVSNGGSDQRMVKLVGTMNFRGESNAIASVLFVESIDGTAVSGATITIDSSHTFTIDGISLPAGTSKTVLLRFSQTPSAATSLELRASFLP